jgi:hypothetical protein
MDNNTTQSTSTESSAKSSPIDDAFDIVLQHINENIDCNIDFFIDLFKSAQKDQIVKEKDSLANNQEPFLASPAFVRHIDFLNLRVCQYIIQTFSNTISRPIDNQSDSFIQAARFALCSVLLQIAQRYAAKSPRKYANNPTNWDTISYEGIVKKLLYSALCEEFRADYPSEEMFRSEIKARIQAEASVLRKHRDKMLRQNGSESHLRRKTSGTTRRDQPGGEYSRVASVPLVNYALCASQYLMYAPFSYQASRTPNKKRSFDAQEKREKKERVQKVKRNVYMSLVHEAIPHYPTAELDAHQQTMARYLSYEDNRHGKIDWIPFSKVIDAFHVQLTIQSRISEFFNADRVLYVFEHQKLYRNLYTRNLPSDTQFFFCNNPFINFAPWWLLLRYWTTILTNPAVEAVWHQDNISPCRILLKLICCDYFDECIDDQQDMIESCLQDLDGSFNQSNQ